MSESSTCWHPGSWRVFPITQQPHYSDQAHLQRIEHALTLTDGVVSDQETMDLQRHLARAAAGEIFILQAGDCAERFDDVDPYICQQKFLSLMMMAVWCELWIGKPVVVVGRIAGQYGKPRSSLYERVDHNIQIPIFRGDLIHSHRPQATLRIPDPDRLWLAAHLSSVCAQDLRRFEGMMSVEMMMASLMKLITQEGGEKIQSALERRFVEPISLSQLPPLYFSHEALILNYEEAMSHYSYEMDRYTNQSAHFLWLGYRTRSLAGAHVEFLRGIANPVGIKLGVQTTACDLAEYLKVLNGDRTPAKLTLIMRFGQDQLVKKLNKLVPVVVESGVPVVWLVDPMHGQGTSTASGQKTRFVEVMIEEVKLAAQTLEKFDCKLGGIHLETTYEQVAECVYQADGEPPAVLSPYTSRCDPRLRTIQALDLITKAFD